MQEIDFFKTPFFLFKSDKKFAEKISEEVSDILKDGKSEIVYRKTKSSNILKETKNKIPLKIPELDFNPQTSVGGFFANGGNNTKMINLPSEIRDHIIKNIEKINLPISFRNIWTNITSEYDYNRVHNHITEADLVFVLYLTKGTLWIQNPHYRGRLDNQYSKVGTSVSLDFNIGDMIVFPGDIFHWVEPHMEDRVTISGNLEIRIN